MMKGYDAIGHRVNGLIKVHKALQQWLSSRVDKCLLEVAQSILPIEKYLIATENALAPDLAIVLYQGKFHHQFSVSASVTASFKMFDMGVVQGCFDSLKEQIQAIREGGVKAEEPSDDDVEEIVAEIGKKGAKPKRAAKATDCEIESLLVKESSAGELVSKLLDRVVQLKLFKLRADENHFRADVQDCIDDFSSLQATIREQAAMLFEADNCKLCSVLEPILVVLRSAIGGGRGHDPPCSIRCQRGEGQAPQGCQGREAQLGQCRGFLPPRRTQGGDDEMRNSRGEQPEGPGSECPIR